MNLLDFHKILSSDMNENTNSGCDYFSEQVTMFNVLNGTFPDSDILSIKSVKEENKPIFSVKLRTENIAQCAVDNLDGRIVPGAYKPLYKLNVDREKDTLVFKMNEVS